MLVDKCQDEESSESKIQRASTILHLNAEKQVIAAEGEQKASKSLRAARLLFCLSENTIKTFMERSSFSYEFSYFEHLVA